MGRYFILGLVLLAGCQGQPGPGPSSSVSATPVATPEAVVFPPHCFKLVNKKSDKLIGVEGESNDPGAKTVLTSDQRRLSQRWLLVNVPPPPATSNPPTILQFKNAASGRSMGARYQTNLNGCNLCLWDQPAVFESWGLEPVEGGYYVLRNRSSQKVMAVEGGSVEDGAKIVQWDPVAGADDQKWKMVEEKTP